VSSNILFGQLLLGLINGSFYALLSMGLAVIFGLLNVINVAQGSFYMLGAFIAWMLLQWLGLNFWWALAIAPAAVALLALAIERGLLRWVYHLDHLYGLLLTFGLMLIIDGLMNHYFGAAGRRYSIPSALTGGFDLGFMFLPMYRAWIVVVSIALCLATWFAIERTKLGSYLRAATENPTLVRALGVNVPLLMTGTFMVGSAMAGFAGVLAAPIYQISPHMGGNLIIVVFAVVVIGGMGSILGSAVVGVALGVLEGFTKFLYPQASNLVVFVVMILVLLVKPAGLFGRETGAVPHALVGAGAEPLVSPGKMRFVIAASIGLLAIAPFMIYPVFLIKLCCFALFACAFNLLIGYGGLLSFGHAAFFGSAAYIAAHAAKEWGLTPELAILSGVAAGAVLGLLFGLVAIRRQGIYFAMITLALSQIVFFLALQMPFTGGEDGIQSVPRGYLFGLFNLESNLAMYYFVAAVFLLGYLAIYRISYSPFGAVLQAIRENPARAISLGYKIDQYKLVAFVLSAALSALAGSTKAIALQLATLTDVHWQMSGEVILMTLLGGMGTLFGPVVGAVLVVTLHDYLATANVPVPVVIGAVFVACILLFRRGIVGEIMTWIAAMRSTRKASAAATRPAQKQAAPAEG
jgi:branched-chain amino acid transport system permease protein